MSHACMCSDLSQCFGLQPFRPQQPGLHECQFSLLASMLCDAVGLLRLKRRYRVLLQMNRLRKAIKDPQNGRYMDTMKSVRTFLKCHYDTCNLDFYYRAALCWCNICCRHMSVRLSITCHIETVKRRIIQTRLHSSEGTHSLTLKI